MHIQSLPEAINNNISTFLYHPIADTSHPLFGRYRALKYTRIDFETYKLGPCYYDWRDSIFPHDRIAKANGIPYYTMPFLKEYYI